MPFIPHTDADVRAMLDEVDVGAVADLFDEIPGQLLADDVTALDAPLSELAVLQRLGARADQDRSGPCFLGAGCYDHHIPAAVWDLTARGEFMTAYTPYQAEASQGTLQLIYEFQSMMAGLTGMDVANASVYDGGSGLAEAILMAVRANKKAQSRTVIVAGTVHPHYVAAARNIVRNQGIELVVVPFVEAGAAAGRIDVEALAAFEAPAAVIVQQPNFFGLLEDGDGITQWAEDCGALVIATVNPLSLALLRPPSDWGSRGADIVCGDGQPLGIPMSSGGPSFGFVCTRRALVRQMPGRIIGRTEDLDGRPGYTLTLQAREQHIRRAKATSNICTNQGLLVTAATVHMSLMGAEGLRRVASASHANTARLVERLTRIDGVEVQFDGPFFHERVLDLGRPAAAVVQNLARDDGLVAGLALGSYFPGLPHSLLVCATEKRSAADIERFAAALEKELGN